MPAKLVWSPLAREDLIEIYELIGLDSPAAAERVYDSIEARTRLLIEHPRLGPRRSDIRAAARMLVEGFYLIFFETCPDSDEGEIDSVEIIRVVDGRRKLTSLL
jgi:toxin ParE1/3/4